MITTDDAKKILDKKEILPSELKQLLELRDKGECNFILMDIREQYEYDMEHIKGCDIIVPTSQFANKLHIIKSYEQPVIMYCRTANRTAQVLSYLMSKGEYDNYSHMVYGIVRYEGEVVKSSTY